MIRLLVLGVALLIFGILVLMRFPDKPGGTISIGGFRVTSAGAGLPLIVLGAVLSGIALWPSPPEISPTPSSVSPKAAPAPPSSSLPPSEAELATMQVTAGPRTSSGDLVKLRVERIVQEGRVLMVTLSARNYAKTAITMRTTSFYVHDTHSGRNYPALADGARWPETVPMGGEKVTGTMLVAGPLDRSASELDVGFSDVRGSPEGTALAVDHVALLPR